MRLEFHQLERRWERMRVTNAQRRRRLLASLAEGGQQVPIVVVAVEGEVERYVVIDGYQRMAALAQLGRDTVEAVVWPMNEPDAVLLDRSLRLAEHESALEMGWLLAEMERRFGYSVEELAQRFDRSVSWVSRRLALVELLPESGPVARDPRACRRRVRVRREEFFFGRIRNEHTRRAYLIAVKHFLTWAEGHGVELRTVSPKDVGQYFDGLQKENTSIATRKQHLAALRHFFDGQVTRHAILLNPALSRAQRALPGRRR